MGEWKKVNKLGIHETLENVVSGLQSVIELELEKNNKKLENLKRLCEMKERRKHG